MGGWIDGGEKDGLHAMERWVGGWVGEGRTCHHFEHSSSFHRSTREDVLAAAVVVAEVEERNEHLALWAFALRSS